MRLQGRNLRVGLTGPDVTELHRELLALGYPVPDAERRDGVFGLATASMVAAFQRARGLLDTAVVDADTAAMLDRAAAEQEPNTLVVSAQPAAAPEPAAVAAALAGDSFAWTGRLLGSTGAPLPAARIVVVVAGAARTVISSGDTRDDGTFALPLTTDDLLAMFRRHDGVGEAWSVERTAEIWAFGPTGRLLREARPVRLDQAVGVAALGDLRVRDDQPAGATFALSVRVLTSTGRPASGLTVTVRDAERGASATLTFGVTDGRGRVRCEYPGGPRATAVDPDRKLRVAVASGAEELASTPVLFSPTEDQVVELVIRDEAYQGPTEFERLTTAVSAVVSPAPLADLDPDDLEDVARTADVLPTRLAWLVQAHRLARFGIPAESWYALLREGLPAGLPSLLAIGPEPVARALRRAYAANAVPRPTSDGETAIGWTVDQLQSLAAAGLLHTDGAGDRRLREAVQASGVSAGAGTAFARAWVGHRGDGRSFWANLRAGGAIPVAEVDTLEFAVRTAALVGHHAPALHGLADLRRSGQVRTLRDLVRGTPPAGNSSSSATARRPTCPATPRRSAAGTTRRHWSGSSRT